MAAILGILAWLVTLAPIVIKLFKWLSKIAVKIAPRGAGGALGKGTLWAAILNVLIGSGVLTAIFVFIWANRQSMFYVAAKTFIPLIGWVLSKVVGMVVPYLPQIGANPHFDKFMTFAASVDYSQPLTILVIGYSISVIIGNFMRTIRI